MNTFYLIEVFCLFIITNSCRLHKDLFQVKFLVRFRLVNSAWKIFTSKKKNEKNYKQVYDKTAFIAIPNDCSMIVVCTKVCLPFHYTRYKYILTRAWLRHSSPLYNRWTCSDGYTHTGHPDTQIQRKPCLQKLLIRETFQKKTEDNSEMHSNNLYYKVRTHRLTIEKQ